MRQTGSKPEPLNAARVPNPGCSRRSRTVDLRFMRAVLWPAELSNSEVSNPTAVVAMRPAVSDCQKQKVPVTALYGGRREL